MDLFLALSSVLIQSIVVRPEIPVRDGTPFFACEWNKLCMQEVVREGRVCPNAPKPR
jgi:hypothetical protein